MKKKRGHLETSDVRCEVCGKRLKLGLVERKTKLKKLCYRHYCEAQIKMGREMQTGHPTPRPRMT